MAAPKITSQSVCARFDTSWHQRQILKKKMGADMTITELADYADLFAAVGVIVSLIFLGIQMRKSAFQASLLNWQQVTEGTRNAREWLKDEKFAEVLVKGRADFESLSLAEREQFGAWHENYLIAYAIMIGHIDQRAIGVEGLHKNAIDRINNAMSFPGARAWYQSTNHSKSWPTQLREAVSAAVELPMSAE